MKKSLLFVLITFLYSLVFAEKIIFSASNMTGQAGNSNTTTTLSGNAYILTETMEIHADDVKLSGEDYRMINASGNIKGKNLETNMEFSCSNLEYDRITKIAQLSGDVDFKDIENEVNVKAQMITYNQETEIVIMQIQINLTQKDNVCTSSYAIYNKKNQMLELSGNAQVKQKEDTFRAQQIELNLDTQEISLDGNVKGSVKDSKKSKESEKTDEKTDKKSGEEIDEENQTENSEENEKSSEVENINKKNVESEEKINSNEKSEEEKLNENENSEEKVNS